jgi:SAM-dependent methyltransferase
MGNVLEIQERVIEGESEETVFAEHSARYVFAAEYARGRRVLDLACGSGYGTRMLHQAGATSVLGMDCDAAALGYARSRYGVEEVSFIQGDGCAPPQLSPFDLIVSFETIEHLDEPARFLTVCHELLAPNGTFIVSTPYRHRMRADGTPLNPFHKQEWRTAEFEELLRGFFAEVTLYGQALKLKKRWFLPLSRRLASPLARIQGIRPGARNDIYRLPGPRFFGLWKSFPGYLIAVCRPSVVKVS